MAEDMIRERQQCEKLLEPYRQVAGERREDMKQEYEGRLDQGLAANETTRKKLATIEQEYEVKLELVETMKREHEAEVEVLKGRMETSHHIYAESAAHTEVVLDETMVPPEEIPIREEGGRESYTLASATQTEDSWA